jgi:cation diffusion facilitator CzcD-associated flavoprotein CzcO
METTSDHVRVAIVGAGFGGLGALVRLKQEGTDGVVLFERAESVGGVWRDNRYPGAACDVESHLYSLSFAPNPDWSRRFSPREEIAAYLERLVDDFGLAPHLRLGHTVRQATWSDDEARWTVETDRGTWTADVLVAAPGALAEPRLPDLPGLDSFRGPAFHTARWDEDAEIDGKRVAVIGTGASAIQVVPAIQPRVGRLVLFQRTPPWVIPRRDKAISERTKRWFAGVPVLREAHRAVLYARHEALGLPFRHPVLARGVGALATLYRRAQVKDPDLRRALAPDYMAGCKRLLLSDDYYPALEQPNVEVVDGGATEIRPHGVVGADGVEREADVVVFGTGFYVTDFPFGDFVVGRGGQSLNDVWQGSPRAHLGTTVAGFPNLFLMMGPNTGLGHSSVLLMLEAQVEHLVNAVRFMDARGVAAVEPRPEAQAAFVDELEADMQRTVWITGGCQSWYLDESGTNTTLWPGSVGSFRRRVEPFRSDEYRTHRAQPEPSYA